MKYFFYNFITFFLILISCSTNFESVGNGVKISKESNNLIIKNNSPDKIYYFVVEQKILAVLNWAPSTLHPSIESRKSEKIPFDEILNGSRIEPVKSGDIVVFYWWTDALQDFNDVSFKFIEL